MLRYIRQKVLYGLCVLLGVVTVVFFLFNLSPADPVRNLVGENAPEQVIQSIRKKLDLDLPLGQRYLLYLNDLSPLSFHTTTDETSRIFFDHSVYQGFCVPLGSSAAVAIKKPYLKRSFLSDKSVSEILGGVLPGTFVLAFVSITLAMLLGVWLGVLAAQTKDSFYDRFILVVSALGMSGPSFFVAILVAWLGAILWRDAIPIPWIILLASLASLLLYAYAKKRWPSAWKWALLSGIALYAIGLFAGHLSSWVAGLAAVWSAPGTGLNMTGSLYSVDVWSGEYLDLKNMILPVITLMIRPLAVIVQLTRSSMLEVMAQDFIRTARAKGLPERTVVWKHALRNALNPVITAVSGWFASLLAGAVFVEFVFGWKGLGQEMFTAIEKQDLPVVMGGVIVIAAAFVVINILVDLIYGWLDPRVRV
jgi:peptide/nickel transport system permease protein